MPEPTLIRGKLHFHSETGTEGGYWALQDERFIEPPTEDWPHERWSYDGLFLLEDRDHLTILAPDGTIYWDGFINLKQHDVFTEDAFGFWIHADQCGIDREYWAKPFFEGWRGELIRGA